MKSSSHIRKGAAALAAALLIGIPGALPAQETGAVVSARAGQRPAQAVPAPEADGLHLSLDEAIRLAMANNQDLNVTINSAESAQFFLFQNTGIYDPLLNANGFRAHADVPASSQLVGANVLQRDTVDAGFDVSQLTPWGGTVSVGMVGNRTLSNSTFDNPNPFLTAGLTLGISQPLLRNFGKRATNIRIDTARNSRDASYQTFVRSVQTTIDAVEQAYWDLVYARANLKVKQEARNVAVELNRITKIKIDVGSMAPIDIVQTEVGVATAEQDIINAEATVGLAGDQLRRLLNWEATSGQTPIVPTDPLQVQRQDFDLREGVRLALEQRPEIIAQGYTVASDQLLYEFWENQTLPQLDLVASYGKNGLSGKLFATNPDGSQVEPPVVLSNDNWFDAADQLFTENFRNWRVGFVFSFPILNRSAKGARGVAEFNLQTEKARQTVLEQDVVVNVRNAHRAIVTAARQIDAAAKGRELAERNLDAARKKYDNGMTTSFEVSQIQNQLSDAQTKELNALAIYRKAVSAYHSATADILEWKGVRIEGMPETEPPPRRSSDQGASWCGGLPKRASALLDGRRRGDPGTLRRGSRFGAPAAGRRVRLAGEDVRLHRGATDLDPSRRDRGRPDAAALGADHFADGLAGARGQAVCLDGSQADRCPDGRGGGADAAARVAGRRGRDSRRDRGGLRGGRGPVGRLSGLRLGSPLSAVPGHHQPRVLSGNAGDRGPDRGPVESPHHRPGFGGGRAAHEPRLPGGPEGRQGPARPAGLSGPLRLLGHGPSRSGSGGRREGPAQAGGRAGVDALGAFHARKGRIRGRVAIGSTVAETGRSKIRIPLKDSREEGPSPC